MTYRLRSIAIAFALLFGVNGSIAVPAQAASAAIGKSVAAETARRAHGGDAKVLSVDEVRSGGKILYRVKLLLDGGVIKIITVDGDNGQIVS